MADSYETTREIEIKLNGSRYRGRYRVMGGTVIVYYENEIKFADCGMTGPELVAKWLLTDLSRRVEAKKRKSGSG
ncbi:hypothetical protein [Paraburkholderia elongata]|uniref:Uncharacterized protein n=1 Tax=Paraburkholderia elongata TaxID=2675747 RepID=A0A972SLY1_9BURK|nr:hypothetical protein [Paraburkholderia elongata]NPT58270.1 hypothetical protein [Paraburkholderia elongata]